MRPLEAPEHRIAVPDGGEAEAVVIEGEDSPDLADDDLGIGVRVPEVDLGPDRGVVGLLVEQDPRVPVLGFPVDRKGEAQRWCLPTHVRPESEPGRRSERERPREVELDPPGPHYAAVAAS
jgi:hypothetical protein